MRVIATSDLHGFLPDFPSGDLLIVGGDLTIYGNKGETIMFARWLDDRPFKHIVVIAGNHDQYLTHKNNPFKRSHYLHNSSVEIEGLKIWGSPYTPRFQDWYFMKDRGYQLRENWLQMPPYLDILVTHGPPHGVLDTNKKGLHTGCLDLMDAIYLKPPKYHFFGHIHESYGSMELPGLQTKFSNCSYLDENYVPKNRFQIIDL